VPNTESQEETAQGTLTCTNTLFPLIFAQLCS